MPKVLFSWALYTMARGWQAGPEFQPNASACSSPTNTSLLRVLEMNGQLLEATQIEFLSMIRDLRKHKQRKNGRPIEVICFHEEMPLERFGSATFAGEKP